MTPLAFGKELNRPEDDLDRFRELAESELDLAQGANSYVSLSDTTYTCTYSQCCQNNDCLTDHGSRGG